MHKGLTNFCPQHSMYHYILYKILKFLHLIVFKLKHFISHEAGFINLVHDEDGLYLLANTLLLLKTHITHIIENVKAYDIINYNR